MPTTISGKLISKDITDFAGFRITATFEEEIVVAGDTSEFVPGRVDSRPSPDGAFELEIPGKSERRGPVRVMAKGADGLPAGEVEIPEEGPFSTVRIRVTASSPTEVTPNPDLTLGAQVKYTGLAIGPKGQGVPANLLVVLWAQKDGADAAAPVSVTRTASGGYFSAPWPSEHYNRAFVVVSGGEPIEVALEDGRIPQRLVAVVPSLPESAAEDACVQLLEPPRAPDAIDLGSNPQSFAADAERCVDFTIPNRTVEEVTYQAVVRTTQPELKPAKPQKPRAIPDDLIKRLASLARLRPIDIRVLPSDKGKESVESTARPAPGAPFFAIAAERLASGSPMADAIANARVLAPGIDLDGGFIAPTAAPDALAEEVLSARVSADRPLQFEASVLAELAREPGGITPRRLLEAEHTSVVRRFRGAVGLLANPTSGRFRLTDQHQIDWDAIPEAYQATTIAHGHILTLKQVWRADGYSLGDLLYSLPLAPGQQKLISVLDWDRREVSSRRAARTATEDVAADLSHDRDVSDIIRSSLSERMDASSHADVAAAGFGIGGFLGPLIFGAAGGVSSAGSTASQTSARAVTGTALNRVRDRTLQSASAVRSQRSTVVQTARQGESVRAQTEVVANYNHCHAVTVEYFEVLRHLQVSQELAQVQECLFVPFAITPFNYQKALRWREPLARRLRRPNLRGAFDAVERMLSNWDDADFPIGRYADEPITHLDGDLRVRIRLPRPADTDDDLFSGANWAPYAPWLWASTFEIWQRYLGVALPQDRDKIWDTRIAPGIAQRILEKLAVELLGSGPGSGNVSVDPTLISRFAQDRALWVSLRANQPLPNWTRAQIAQVRLHLDVSDLPAGAQLPPGAELLVDSASMGYRTEYFTHHLFSNRRALNDLTFGDDVRIATPLDLREKRNPRDRDRRNAEHLVDHLNEHIEYYHRAIWLDMDPNRRYLLLDGFIAPDAGGRSVASVVENRVIGIVGNSMVMPVAPGQRLDRTYAFAAATPEDLRELYAADPSPPMRISMPTSGVFAEAVMGHCNSCEFIDDTRFWRWEEAPIPDQPTLIAPLSTDSRRTTPPSLAPDAFPDALVKLQTAPAAPDPTGLAAAVNALGVNNIFKDLTGLALNQENAAEALKASIKTAQNFATQAGALAQQRFLNRELDRGLEQIKSARDQNLITGDQAKELTEGLLRGAIGEKRPPTSSPTKIAALQRAMERVPNAKRGSMRVTRPEGTVEVKTGDGAGRPALNVVIEPEIAPIKQPSNMTCWAAGGAMMASWRAETSLSIEAVLDGVGGVWRGKFDRNEGLTAAEVRAFLAALGLVEEGAQSYTPEGLARLLADKGPLLEIGDDSIENNLVVHVRIITAVRGDGTPEGTTITLADSASGTIIPAEPFVDFDRRHGAADAVRFGVGLFHF